MAIQQVRNLVTEVEDMIDEILNDIEDGLLNVDQCAVKFTEIKEYAIGFLNAQEEEEIEG